MTFHPMAKNVVRKHLEKILSSVALDPDGKYSFETFDFDTIPHLTREILKTKEDYLNQRNIFEIIFINIFQEVRRIENKFPPTTPTIFRNLLGEERSNALIDKIIKLFESIPRDYFIEFPLPALPEIDEKQLFLTKQISIVQMPDEPPKNLGALAEGIAKARRRGLLDFGEKFPTKYLRIKSKGYVSPSMSDVAIVNALSIFKQILYLGIAEKIFLIGNEATLFRLFGYSQDCSDPAIKEEFELPSNISGMLCKLKIQNFGGEEISNNKSTNDTTIKKIKDIFIKHEKFFNAKDDDKNVERIKTAIEWAFDSKINENETFAYIQTCIALDSILGKEESDEQRSLTETVADRGSYLLGKNIEERKKISSQLKDLLRVRGKLVHGRNLRLKDEDRKFFLPGQDILSRAIMKELSYL